MKGPRLNTTSGLGQSCKPQFTSKTRSIPLGIHIFQHCSHCSAIYILICLQFTLVTSYKLTCILSLQAWAQRSATTPTGLVLHMSTIPFLYITYCFIHVPQCFYIILKIKAASSSEISVITYKTI